MQAAIPELQKGFEASKPVLQQTAKDLAPVAQQAADIVAPVLKQALFSAGQAASDAAVELGKQMGARVVAAASSQEKVDLCLKHGFINFQYSCFAVLAVRQDTGLPA